MPDSSIQRIDVLPDMVSGTPAVETAAVQMNPVNAGMQPLSPMDGRGQKEGLSDLTDLTQAMLAEMQKPDGTARYVDLGGADTRPGDLSAHFDPKMDQGIRLYTGRGDDTVIIV